MKLSPEKSSAPFAWHWLSTHCLEQVQRLIAKAGKRGCTQSELVKNSRAFRKLDHSMQRRALDHLLGTKEFCIVDFPPPPSGQARKAYVLINVDNVDTLSTFA